MGRVTIIFFHWEKNILKLWDEAVFHEKLFTLLSSTFRIVQVTKCPKEIPIRKLWIIPRGLQQNDNITVPLMWKQEDSRKLVLYSKLFGCKNKRCHQFSSLLDPLWHSPGKKTNATSNFLVGKYTLFFRLKSPSSKSFFPHEPSMQQLVWFLFLFHWLLAAFCLLQTKTLYRKGWLFKEGFSYRWSSLNLRNYRATLYLWPVLNTELLSFQMPVLF